MIEPPPAASPEWYDRQAAYFTEAADHARQRGARDEAARCRRYAAGARKHAARLRAQPKDAPA